MNPWREGDPVGVGVVCLPDTKTKQAYARACKRLRIKSAAQHVIRLRTLQERRDFISSYPEQAREELKDRVRKLWEAQKLLQQNIEVN